MNESVNAVAVADFRFRNNEKECFAGIKVDEDGLFGESIEWNWIPENLVKINQNSKINDDNEQNKKNKKKSKKKIKQGKSNLGDLSLSHVKLMRGNVLYVINTQKK